jgi:hypothetical protein
MYLSAYSDLPPAGESWQANETDLDGGQINELLARNVIEPVERAENGSRRVWQTRESVWERIEDLREDLGLLPCGHRPFSTVDLDSDQPYSCLGDGCDARYDRGEIEAVIDGE